MELELQEEKTCICSRTCWAPAQGWCCGLVPSAAPAPCHLSSLALLSLSAVSEEHLPGATVSGKVPGAVPAGQSCAGRCLWRGQGLLAQGLGEFLVPQELLKTFSSHCSFGRPLLAGKPPCCSLSFQQHCLPFTSRWPGPSSQWMCSAGPFWLLFQQHSSSGIFSPPLRPLTKDLLGHCLHIALPSRGTPARSAPGKVAAAAGSSESAATASTGTCCLELGWALSPVPSLSALPSPAQGHICLACLRAAAAV